MAQGSTFQTKICRCIWIFNNLVFWLFTWPETKIDIAWWKFFMDFSQVWSSARFYSCASLLLLYINDIVEDINSFIRLFADDTSLYIIVENPFQAAEQLNSDLQKIHRWAAKWLVTFQSAHEIIVLITYAKNEFKEDEKCHELAYLILESQSLFFCLGNLNHSILRCSWTKPKLLKLNFIRT